MTTTTSRAEFLTLGAKGGIALMAGGAVIAAATGKATAAGGDVAIASLAATAELLAIDFYGKAIDGGGFTGDVLAYMKAARQNEQDHYDALAKVLGSSAPSGLTFVYPDGTFASEEMIATTGAALETAFVGAYMGAITALRDNGLKQVAAQIGANEAQHLSTLNSLSAGGKLVPNPAFPDVLTAKETTAAVTPFLG